MNIIVLVKQVPDTTEIHVDKETGTLKRAGVPTIINPDDQAGLEVALTLKETIGAKVTVLTMGPGQAKSMLHECLATGADEAYLISDRQFAGSDTWATSKILSEAIKTLDYDLIIAGRQAIDGDTAQVGPQVAEFLKIPQVTYVEKVHEVYQNTITITKAYEDYKVVLNAKMPCLLTVLSDAYTLRYMDAKRLFETAHQPIPTLTNDTLSIDVEHIGLKGSPTRVKKTFVKAVNDKRQPLALNPEDAADKIIESLRSIS